MIRLALAGVIATAAWATERGLETPEATIDTYYTGYRTGDKRLTAKAVGRSESELSDAGFDPPALIGYDLIRVRKVTHKSEVAQPGDVEVVTEATWRDSGPPQATVFFLRRYGTGWRILWHGAIPSKDHPGEPSFDQLPPYVPGKQ